MIVRYDPSKHADLPLLEWKTIRKGGEYAIGYIKSLVDRETANAVPWLFWVDDPELTERGGQNDNQAYASLHFPGDSLLKFIQAEVVNTMGEEANIEKSDPKTFHITLFYAEDMTDEQLQRMIRSVSPGKPIMVELVDIDVFYNTFDENTPLILRVRPSEMLFDLQRKIAEAAEAQGVVISEYSNPKRFVPHITLGYIGNPDYEEMIPRYGRGTLGSIEAKSITYWRDDYKKVAERQMK